MLTEYCVSPMYVLNPQQTGVTMYMDSSAPQPNHNGEAMKSVHTRGAEISQLQEELARFSSGEYDTLINHSLLPFITDHILQLYHSGQMGEALILLQQIGEVSISKTSIHRERSLVVLSLVAEKILDEENEDLLEAIADLLMRWLRVETEFNGSYEYICQQLSQLLQRMLKLELWYQAEKLIATLSEIKIRGENKSRLLSRIITRIHGNIAQRNLLDALIESYVDVRNGKSDIAGALLLHLGDKSAPQMLGTLSTCDSKEQRFRLLNLLPEAGENIVPSLVRELNNTPSWYFARNIIHIIARLGSPELFDYVEPFMEHKDIRVQKEVIDCASKISENGLLKALDTCDDSLKPSIIKLIGPRATDDIGSKLRGVLDNYTLFNKQLQGAIIEAVCDVIHFYPGEESEQILEILLRDYAEFKHFQEQTLQALKRAQITLSKSHLSNATEKDLHVSPHDVILTSDNDVITIPREMNRKNTSSDDWYAEVTASDSYSKSFKQHIERRIELYSSMNREEFAAFSALMKKKVYLAGDMLATTGDMHSQLFFIEQGEVAMLFPDDGNEVHMQNLQQGDIIGHDIFMSGSEWYLSLRAATDAVIFSFDQEQLLNLQPSYPMLCQKIMAFSKNHDIALRLHNSANADRFNYSPPNSLTLHDSTGEQITEIKILDQFSHGICFCFEQPDNFNTTLISDHDLTLFFDREPSKPIQVTAQTIGYKFYRTSPRRLCVFARFKEETNLSGYSCSHISL